MNDGLVQSHKDLLETLRIARRELARVNFGQNQTKLLALIDRVLDEAKTAGFYARIGYVPVQAQDHHALNVSLEPSLPNENAGPLPSSPALPPEAI